VLIACNGGIQPPTEGLGADTDTDTDADADADTVALIRGLQLGAVPLVSVLDDLLVLGLVQAQPRTKEPRRSAAEVSDTSGGERRAVSSRVGQRPTKTTPTCLSSYLR